MDEQSHKELMELKEASAPVCFHCGSKRLVNITPITAGPTGWAIRCKDCGHRWCAVCEQADCQCGWLCDVCGQPVKEDGTGDPYEHVGCGSLAAEKKSAARWQRNIRMNHDGGPCTC